MRAPIDLPTNPLRFRRKGHSADYPFIILALMLNRAIGDFIDQNLFAASVKQQFDHARLFVYYRDDRPYKRQIIEMNPLVDRQLVAHDRSVTIPVDYFDIVSGRPIEAPDPSWYQSGAAHPDLLLTPSMMTGEALLSFDRLASFRIDDKGPERPSERLARLGLDPNRWYACLHYREPSYGYRPPSSLRDIDPEDFLALAGYIIDTLGGQVVRLGHPEMAPFPPRPGFVDLSPWPDSFDLQAFAISRARFVVASPSGMATLASAFDVPVGLVDNVMPFGVHRAHDAILVQHVVTPDGQRLPLSSLTRRGLLYEGEIARLMTERGFTLVRNTVAELIAMARLLHAETAGIDAWRVPLSDPLPGPRPNAVTLPIPERRRPRIIEFPDAAPPFPQLTD